MTTGIELQLVQFLAQGGATVAFIWLVIDMRREWQRREEAQAAEYRRREGVQADESRHREELLRSESSAREQKLLGMLSECSGKLDKITSVLNRMERWLEKTE